MLIRCLHCDHSFLFETYESYDEGHIEVYCSNCERYFGIPRFRLVWKLDDHTKRYYSSIFDNLEPYDEGEIKDFDYK
jgi:hypothetical protein